MWLGGGPLSLLSASQALWLKQEGILLFLSMFDVYFIVPVCAHAFLSLCAR